MAKIQSVTLWDGNTYEFEDATAGALVVEKSTAFNSLPQTISNSKITSDMVAVKAELSNPAAQTSDWTVTTANGSLSVSGSISGSTTLKLYLLKQQ